jgi:hypothetical protein
MPNQLASAKPLSGVLTINMEGTPEIKIMGNWVSIANGDTSPSVIDATDFDDVDVANGTFTSYFQIVNTGSVDLHLTGTPLVEISGPNAADFMVTEQPPETLEPGVTGFGFEIAFDPSDYGVRTAVISIANDDADENPYTFAIQGTGVDGASEMDMYGRGKGSYYMSLLTNGDTSPDVVTGTDFGNVDIDNGIYMAIFRINNSGNANLGLTGTLPVEISGPHASDFTVTTQPPSTLGIPSAEFFEIVFDPSSEGIRLATVSIANNDPDDDPYTFTIQGTGITGGVAEMSVHAWWLHDNPIADGNTSPSPLDATDFRYGGAVNFCIENTGSANLVLTGNPAVEISGPNAADVTAYILPDTGTLVPPGSGDCQGYFGLNFVPGESGLRSATVSIANDGPGNPFTFAIQAWGTGTFTSCAEVNIPQAECEALVALYNSTDGTHWTDHTDWLQTNAPCNWYGVVCSDGHVTALDLGYNQLTGPIPPELGNLINLTELDLAGNQLQNSIPVQLGDLSNLLILDLRSNQLSGSIPAELGNITNLDILSLYNNQLTGPIPPELGNLTNLTFLYLVANQLSGPIPPELGNLTNLTSLSLGSNQLTGFIPSQLGNLTNLTSLTLDNNQLTGFIPAQLGNLVNLYQLALAGNQLSGSIPVDLGNLIHLKTLALDRNHLSGPIPSELGSLTNLHWLTLKDNHLSGEFPTSITNLVNLTTLTFDCWITSSDPAVIAFVETLVPGWQDNVCLQGIVPVGDPITSAASVDFTVTFSESVQGVDPTDFHLATTGDISGESVLNVAGGPTTYMVTVNTGTGNGTIRLDVVDDDSILDQEGNPLGGIGPSNGNFSGGAIYTIIKTYYLYLPLILR